MNTVCRLKFSPAARRSLGTTLLACAMCWPGVTTYAESQPAPPPQQQQQQGQPGDKALLTQADLKELVGPIALYPDALIALILPASTVPADVVLGARFVDSKGDPAQAGNQPWDDSVKSLVNYPDVLSWMNENLEWTSSLGEAFMDQPADVMNAIQALRLQAKASGALTDTPQQRVVEQQDTIRIIPADPEVIYVPQYDPEVIFVDSYAPGYTPYLTFGIGFAVGSWLNYDCDWRDRCVYRGDWIGWNRGGRGWDRGGDVFINNTDVNVNVVNINANNATRWSPSNRALRQLSLRQRNGGGNARFTRAEARQAREMIRSERRDNNGKLSASALAAARRDALPTPSRLQLRESAFNRTARNQARDNREENRGDALRNNAALAEARRNRDDATPNRPNAAERQEMRRKTPTEAPRVAGQLEAPRQQQVRSEQRQNVRQQFEDRAVNRPSRLDRDTQVPTRAPRMEDSNTPSNRPSISERQTESRQSMQNFRQERSEQRENRSANQPRQRQERPSQPKVQRQERRESRPQVNREPQRQQRSERPQPQRQERKEARPQRQEARQERHQDNRSANRPQPQRQDNSSKKSNDKDGDRKKKD